MYARPAIAMEETPRFAFGHLLDQDGCDEDDALTIDVMGAATGDSLCSVTLAAEDPVQYLTKTRIVENGQRLDGKSRLRSVLPSPGRSASASPVVS